MYPYMSSMMTVAKDWMLTSVYQRSVLEVHGGPVTSIVQTVLIARKKAKVSDNHLTTRVLHS